ncbi:hypothetical protein Slin14017_G017280 [Septoria linicola]|nr:hypothetical protein Slin14017_G017280 [Septoria linicola]
MSVGFGLGAGAGAGVNAGAGGGFDASASAGAGHVGAGLSTGFGVLPAIGSLFTFGLGGQAGAGLGVGGHAGAGFGFGVGGSGQGQGDAGAGGSAEAGFGFNGGAGGDGHGNAGSGADAGAGAGVGGSAGWNGEDAAGGQVGGQAGWSDGGDSSSGGQVEGSAVGNSVGHDQAGAGGGYRVTLNPVPVVPIEASGSAVLSASVSTGPNGKPQCTVQGGPATLLYFPPLGQQGSLDSANAAANGPAPPSPAGGEVYTTLGQIFQPGQAYISCQTLWAGYTDDKGSVTQTGPTFTNAIFPVPSDQISTQCLSAVDAKATAGGQVPMYSAGKQVDFGSVHNVSEECRNIAPPPSLLNMVPEWKDYAFWNMQFEQPECIPQKDAPEPKGPVWSPDASCSPTVVQPTTSLVPTAPAAVATPGPSSPESPAKTPTADAVGGQPPADTPTSRSTSAGAYTATARANETASTTRPAAYTGGSATSASSKSSLMVGALLLAMLMM